MQRALAVFFFVLVTTVAWSAGLQPPPNFPIKPHDLEPPHKLVQPIPRPRPDGGVIAGVHTTKEQELRKKEGARCPLDGGVGRIVIIGERATCVSTEDSKALRKILRAADGGAGAAATAAQKGIRAKDPYAQLTDDEVALALMEDGGREAIPPKRLNDVTLTFGGDVTLGFHYEEWFDEKTDAGIPRDEMFAWGFKEVLPVIDGGDLFVVNLECPFTARGEKIPKNFNFRARPEFINTISSAGVDVVSLANNHMMDYGAIGLLDTLDALDRAKIKHFGAGRTLAEARQPTIVVVNGVKIAFLGYFFMGDRYIEPPEVIASAKTPGVAGDTKDTGELDKMMQADIQSALGYADLVIPFFHWGREGMNVPEPYQTRLAHLAIDSGAAAVIGSHPHVLQGMELYKGAPILYSLGNFVFGGNWNPKNKESVIVKLTFDAGKFDHAQLTPIYTDRYPEKPVQPYVVSGDEATQLFRHLAEYSSGLGQMLPELKPYAAVDAGTR
ncbi:MAG: CapA family protein [Myxococcaceae bacterium]